jgi:glutaredoxin-related protein
MAATQGWRDLLEDIDLMLSSTDTVKGVETVEQLHFRKGEVSIMTWLKNLKQSSEEVYEQLQQEEDNAQTTV